MEMWNSDRVATSEGAKDRPIFELKAGLFKSLAHPARVRILELLVAGPHTVAQLQQVVGLETSHLSQQLGVLRRGGLVKTVRTGATITYSLADPVIAELLAVARGLLISQLTATTDVLADLRSEPNRRTPRTAS